MNEDKRSWTGASGFLSALARDVRANTIAIMTMALIPLAGLVGGGLDISRMYIVKTRLQHACDAGALAGRKAMGGGVWTQTVKINNVDVPNYPRVSAEKFFDANYNTAAYGVLSATRAFSENAGKVSGVATAVLPMTLMKVFGRTNETLSVTCDAEMRLPNTDVMFVLDTTGSMASTPANGNCNSTCVNNGGSKIQILRVAVKCFYEIVARLDTDATCTAGNPSGGTGSDTQIRFGFVPYSVNVNVGKLLPNSYFPDSWEYQSRKPYFYNPPQVTTNGPYWENYSNAINQSDCLKYMNNQPFGNFTPTPLSNNAVSPNTLVTVAFNSDGSADAGNEWGWYGADNSGTTRSCRRSRTDTTTTYFTWDYDVKTVDFHALKAGGSSWNNTFTAPNGANGADQTITWDGCIEERKTLKDASSYNPSPAEAYDLDIDMVPTGDIDTQWKPALKPLIYLRKDSSGNVTRSQVYNTGAFGGPGYSCPTQAKKLQAWPVASDFDNYVDSLVADGNTYHDIGMIWGARLMSPTGIFKSENEFTPKGGDIERHMIYMTDGIAQANPCDYSAYGVAWYDRRTTDTVGSASSCGSESAALDASINARLTGLCTAVKNKNITLWVITFGAGVDQATKTRLQACATPGRYFDAGDAVALQKSFASIATEISQLRLTK